MRGLECLWVIVRKRHQYVSLLKSTFKLYECKYCCFQLWTGILLWGCENENEGESDFLKVVPPGKNTNIPGRKRCPYTEKMQMNIASWKDNKILKLLCDEDERRCQCDFHNGIHTSCPASHVLYPKKPPEISRVHVWKRLNEFILVFLSTAALLSILWFPSCSTWPVGNKSLLCCVVHRQLSLFSGPSASCYTTGYQPDGSLLMVSADFN